MKQDLNKLNTRPLTVNKINLIKELFWISIAGTYKGTLQLLEGIPADLILINFEIKNKKYI